MTKKIAVINDLSGFGRCSLTAAISVISVMGVQPCPLPTAILSGQTGYPHYYCDSYTDKMPLIRTEWEKMGVRFDGICTGFLADERQVKQIQMFLDSFLTEDTFLLVDPVLGGDGKPHGLFTEGLLEKMRELCQKADIITPNLTELCLLTGADYGELGSIKNISLLMEVLSELARSLLHGRLREVLVTGICYTDGDGVPMMGNLDVTAGGHDLIPFPCIGGSYSGTGDLFAACIAAGMARGDTVTDTVRLAGKFISLALSDSIKEQVPRNDGVNYEKYLSMLAPSGTLCNGSDTHISPASSS
ncbi:pyridoxamine kinase [Lachnoclostridium sp. An118]|uniref:pyridoxamine kinase n=1 Tax=Lachnoclostridium sp. An118 TaxID=1965547 RepID=UPI000B388092|nr:pyridoxamine kinase [Lachnoclostridium sp. An118]OUQ51492.1 pyridoxine kinase [Lachnoclostridium sp. An118]